MQKNTDDLNSPEEREKLTNLNIGVAGQMAAHETGGLLRMHRGNWPVTEISRITGIINGPPLIDAMQTDINKESNAGYFGRPIYDGHLGPTKYCRAKEVVVGDELLEHGAPVVSIGWSAEGRVFHLEGGKQVPHRLNDEVLVRSAV